MPIVKLTAENLGSPSLRAGITSVALQFMAEAQFPLPFNPEHFFNFWHGLLTSGIGTFFVAEDGEAVFGVMGCIFAPDSFSGVLVGMESFWFITKEKRQGRGGLRLFNAFEDECKARGAKMNYMVHLDTGGMRGEALAEFYKRRGYVPAESFFRKVN